jgi:hypothetical protein
MTDQREIRRKAAESMVHHFRDYLDAAKQDLDGAHRRLQVYSRAENIDAEISKLRSEADEYLRDIKLREMDIEDIDTYSIGLNTARSIDLYLQASKRIDYLEKVKSGGISVLDEVLSAHGNLRACARDIGREWEAIKEKAGTDLLYIRENFLEVNYDANEAVKKAEGMLSGIDIDSARAMRKPEDSKA